MHPKKFQKLSITLNEHTHEQVKSMHYLGVDVDENLTWEVHIKILTRVLSYKLYTIDKASKYVNSALLKNFDYENLFGIELIKCH